MGEIKTAKLYYIEGGATISGTLVNAFSTGIKTILDVGRSFGTAIRRIALGKLCEL